MSRLRIKNQKLQPPYVIGIDEVGRGALAGPITVGAVLLPRNLKIKSRVNLPLKDRYPRQPASMIELRDSKKLTPRQREIWFQWITRLEADCAAKSGNADKRGYVSVNQHPYQRQPGICYATASVSPKIIDKINIANAANLAASRAFHKLVNNATIVSLLTKGKIKVFLDGGLFLDKNLIRINQLNQRQSVSTVIRGDEKIPAVMLASIIAKVSRDRLMIRLHRKYPQYGFSQHKGYGTKKHIEAIKKYGRLPIHRKSFKIK